jgi:hypothetical protein
MRNRGVGFTYDSRKPLEKTVAVGVLPEDLATFDTPANDMVQSTRGTDAGSTRHAGSIAVLLIEFNI